MRSFNCMVISLLLYLYILSKFSVFSDSSSKDHQEWRYRSNKNLFDILKIFVWGGHVSFRKQSVYLSFCRLYWDDFSWTEVSKLYFSMMNKWIVNSSNDHLCCKLYLFFHIRPAIWAGSKWCINYNEVQEDNTYHLVTINAIYSLN